MPKKNKAQWIQTLETKCPHCKKVVDLLDDEDFWEYHDFEIGETGTEKTKGVSVDCPECDGIFNVDLR